MNATMGDCTRTWGTWSARFIPSESEDGFPRIVSGDLRTGISDVRYLVSTASCGDFRMKDQRPEGLLEGLI